MDNYYYLNARNEQQGPVPGEQLPSCGVNLNTKVWKQGMSQWKPVSEIPELVSLFEQQNGAVPPPPPPSFGYTPQNQKPPMGLQKPDNLLVWSILATVLCCLPLGIVAIIYSNKVDPLWNEGKYEESVKAAASAKMYCLIALGLGVVGGIIGFFIGFLSAL